MTVAGKLAAMLLGMTAVAVIAAPAFANVIPLIVERNDALPAVEKWHYRTAIPFPEGTLLAGTKRSGEAWQTNAPVELLDAKQKPIPCQFTTLATWYPSEEGKEAPPELIKRTGIRWLGLDFTAPLPAQVFLCYGEMAKDWKPVESPHALKVTESDEAITVDNGLIRFTVKKKGYNFIDSLTAGGKEIIAPGSGKGAYATREDGTICWSANDTNAEVKIEVAGPMLTVIRAEGFHRENAEGKSVEGKSQVGKGFCKFVVRIYAYADVPYVKVQHTWINTEDTDKTRFGAFGLFVPGRGAVQGVKAPEIPGDESLAFLVKDWDHFEWLRISQVTGSVARMATGGEAGGGWFQRGAIGIGIRDFAQNYPKEVEFAPNGTWLHFWPRHGEDSARVINNGNLWRQWFCHEGRLLDLKVPKSYDTLEMRPNVMFQGDGFSANGMGVAKTHELLLVFGDAAQQVERYHAAFDADPGVTAGGEWNCRSGALGNMMWEDPQDFPMMEKYFLDSHEAYVAWRERNHDWGMWSFGDTHTAYWFDSPTYYRMMAGAHHGHPTVAWHLYVRSGRQTYLTQARRKTQHMIDVDHCHYVAPDYTKREFSNGKTVGGVVRCYGYVHWYNAMGDDFDSIVDYMWLDYYFHGNLRARDVALEHGQLLRRSNSISRERQGAAVQNVLMDMYLATWDLSYWNRFQENLPKVVGYKPDEPIDRLLNYMPWWRKYLDVCPDAQLQKFVIRFADQMRREDVSFGADLIAEAFRLTSKPEYLLCLQRFFNEFEWNYYDPTKYDKSYPFVGGGGGVPGQVGYQMGFSFDVQKNPYAMRAFHDAPVKPGFTPSNYPGLGACPLTGTMGLHVLMILENHEGKPILVPAGYFAGPPAWHSVIGPDGEIVALQREGGPGVTNIPASNGKPGLYAVYFCGQGLVRPPEAVEKVVFVPEDDVGLAVAGTGYIMVPPGTTRFVIHYVGNNSSVSPGRITILDPSGQVRYTDMWPGVESGERKKVEIAPRPEETGRAWLIIPAGFSRTLLQIEGIPEGFTTAPDRFVDPARLETYLRRLRTGVLPNLRDVEQKEALARVAADRAELTNSAMNGVMEVLHYDRRCADNDTRKYGRVPDSGSLLETPVGEGKYVEWKTRPVPPDAMNGAATVFYWAGNMSGAPKSDDPRWFVLSINGRDAVLFGASEEDKTWPGAIEGVSLKFEYRKFGVEHPGIFRLTVPTKLLRAGEPVTLRLRGRAERLKNFNYVYGAGSEVWIGIYEACIRKPGTGSGK